MSLDARPVPETRPSPGAGAQPLAQVVAVAASLEHGFTKQTLPVVRLVEGFGIEGDAHAGPTVQHLSRKRRDPGAPNLRQVHLLAAELFEEVHEHGHRVLPGDLGENVTTSGIDLLALPTGTVLVLGDTAEVRLTGLRNPCWQIDDFQDGLLGRVRCLAADGSVLRRVGVMGVVHRSGEVRPGDPMTVVLPEGEHVPLRPV